MESQAFDAHRPVPGVGSITLRAVLHWQYWISALG
jgi:hypothetical protein